MSIKIHQSRRKALQEEFSKPYFLQILETLKDKKTTGEIIYPEEEDIFAAYDLCPLDDLKVVILGQDPYHWPWQAHGLSFSVRKWVKTPPSLRNILSEVESDKPPESALSHSKPSTGGNSGFWWRNGDLTRRAHQWVLLLNSVLTVTQWQPASHSMIGRQEFTDTTIKIISEYKEWVVFLLRWTYARSKKDLIDTSKHLVLEASHPSPLSAYRWFLGCRHFSQTNTYVTSRWFDPIDR